MIVLDASVLANAVGDDGIDGAAARTVIAADVDVAIPDLANIEPVARAQHALDGRHTRC